MWLLALFSVLTLLAAAEDPFDQSIQALVNEPWFPSPDEFAVEITNVSPQCQNDTQRWIGSLESIVKDVLFCALSPKLCTDKRKKELKQNIYAIKQFDSFSKAPSGILMGKTMSFGTPSECKQVSQNYIYKTKFCFVHSNVGQSCSGKSSFSWTSTVCMPASCSDTDIVEVLNQLNLTSAGGLLDHCTASCVKDEPETNTFTWIFTGIMGGIILLCLVGSGIDYILEHALGNPADLLRNPGIKAIVVFSVFTNGFQILDTRPAREGHIRSLDCIRFFSMLWVVSGHVFIYYMTNDELFPVLKIPKQALSDTLMNAFFSVDTFFVLSGLLVSYMFFKMAQKNPRMVKNPFTWVLFYVHRFLRLTPPYMLFIGFYIVVIPLFTGVLNTFFNNQETVDLCKKYWWKNLLYINNFDADNTCYGITWYLACDTQMYIAAPILLVAFFISYKIGLIAALLIIIGSTAACIAVIVAKNLPAIATFAVTGSFMQDIYAMPWMRCPPYILGICTGYFLAKYGNKKLRVNKLNILVGWTLAIAIALACIYGPHDYLDLHTHWSKGVRGIYNSLSRIGWGLFICWVVVANHYGWAGPISSFMCHPLWQPLGRLSYTAYLVHMFIIMWFFNLFDHPLHFTSPGEQFITCTIPITVIAYIFAFFWSCLCELPFLKLEKLLVDGLMRRGRRSPEVAPVKQEEIKENVEKQETIENWNEVPEVSKVQQDDTHL